MIDIRPKTYRRGGLAGFSINTEDMLRKVTNGTGELKPVDVLRACRCGYVSRLVCDHKRIRVALLRRCAEIEGGAHTSAREGVRNEVMLPKDDGVSTESVNDVLDSN